MSEITAHGDAQAFITIDGKVQGGLQTVTALHGTASEAMSFLLDLAPGPHTASVAFLNAAATRALFVDSVVVAGQAYNSAAAALHSTAPTNFAFSVAPPPGANSNLFVTAAAPVQFLAPHV